MDTLLKPARLDLDPNSPTATKEWRHWHRTFTNFIDECGERAPDKHRTLVNYVSHNVYEYIEGCEDYDSAIRILEQLFVKTPNEVFARHLLATRRQKPGESLTEFLQELHKLSKDCNLRNVTAEQYREELVRDSFINGLLSSLIRQRLLENRQLDLKTAFDQAMSLDLAQKNSEVYTMPGTPTTAALPKPSIEHTSGFPASTEAPGVTASRQTSGAPTSVGNSLAAAVTPNKCFFCGDLFHNRRNCPARNCYCNKCGKKGHYAKVCKSKVNADPAASMFSPALCTITAACPESLIQASAKVSIGGTCLIALIDSGSSDSYISENMAKKLCLKLHPSTQKISMALTSLKTNVLGHCFTPVTLDQRTYPSVRLGVLKDLCSDIILGQDFQKEHKSVTIEFGGSKPELVIAKSTSACALSTAAVEKPSLFANLLPNCKPIATKSRRFSSEDEKFINQEITKLLDEGIIEPSTSPWRAQVVVSKDPLNRHKKRLCIDYSQTINLYTELDAYPLPRIDDMVNKLAKYKVFSTFDLKSAYHQVPIKGSDRKYTGFEANGRLYQFCRVPFGLTNGVAVFQRAMDRFVQEEKLDDTFPFLDNITVAGQDQEEHDKNAEKFHEAIKRRNLTLNEGKSIESKPFINVLGYCVGNGVIAPDEERLRPLQEFPPPKNIQSLRRVVGMFAYYAKWIPNFSDKIRPLVEATNFPLEETALSAFNMLKKELEKATLQSIDESLPFVVECDASEVALSATLNQGGRPVAFMSRSLHGSELHYPPVEKEAMAIIEAVRKWQHFLAGRHFTLKTDQRSVAYMFDNRRRTKIKNNKIQDWRLELASFSYTVEHRPGKENVAPDSFTRAFLSSMSTTSLKEIHSALCHPGVTRMLHFVRSKNLPYSTDDVKKMCASCRICAELKPQFYQPPTGALIKATQPMERLSIDFKGPLPTATRNAYLLTVVDEYSRFPFAFPCPDMSSSTVIKCLDQIFTFCGMPSYIHSDRGTSFLSQELKQYLSQRGIATSKTTPYHPIGNGQVERYNGIIWKSVRLSLKSMNLPDSRWELALPDALHSIRSLLSTSTNATPHERFFNFQRRSSFGTSLPSWLQNPGPVLLRRFVRLSKNDPLVDQVQLIDVNPTYAHIKYQDGRESTVSLRDLAPCPCTPPMESPDSLRESVPISQVGEESTPAPGSMQEPNLTPAPSDSQQGPTVEAPVLRRSTRQIKPPARYGW